MALPNKKINKIQLDKNNSESVYEIIPGSLQSNGYQLSPPTLTGDATIALTSDLTPDTNQKVKTGSVTFADNDVINIVAGTGTTVTGNASAKTITIGSNGIPYGQALMETNPFGGKKLYINSLYNAFANADKKYYVTITKHSRSSGGVTYPYIDSTKTVEDDGYYVDGPVVGTLTSSAHTLFDGSYEGGISLENTGDTYLKIRIMFGTNTSPSTSTSYWSGYPYGSWYLSFYYNNTPNTASQARVYNKYAAHTKGWHLYNSSYFSGQASGTNVIQLIADSSDYQRTCVDFIIYGNDTSGRTVTLTEIDYKLDRPDLAKNGSTLTSFGPMTLYENFTWSKDHKDVFRISNAGKLSWFTSNGTDSANISSSDGTDINITTSGKANYNSKEIATVDDIQTAINALPEPMIFKGSATITKSGSTYTVSVSVPSSASDIKEGYTYKIISAPTNDATFKAGDTLIADQDTPGTNPQSHWTLIPSGDEPSGTVTSVDVAAASDSHLTVSGGPITSSGLITVGVDSDYALHSHSNKSALDNLSQAVIDDAHSHTNKTALDNLAISSTGVTDGTNTYNASDKLDKLTYEWNKSVAMGSSGYVKIGSFPMYDSNITIDIDATTAQTYHGTVVIATQNVSTTSIGSAHKVEVYDDPSGEIASAIRVVWTSGSRNYDVYFVPKPWSKNLIHIRAVALSSTATDVCISQTGTAPTSTSGLEAVNKLATVAGTGSYDDLTNKPTIPSVSNATITVTQTGQNNQTFTLNGSATTISLADTNTTYTFAEGSTDGAFSVTPSGGSAQSVSIHGLGSNAFNSTTIPTTYLKSASSSGNTLTLTKQDNTTVTYTPSFTDTNTTYTISTSSTNGNITVTPSSGTAYDVSIPGLGSNAYTSTSYIPTSGSTAITGQLTLSTAASQNLGSAAKPWGSLHTVYTRFDSNGGSGSSYSNKANVHYDDATESLVFEFV